jgi:hypothetical protein
MTHSRFVDAFPADFHLTLVDAGSAGGTQPRGRCAWLGSYNHNTRSRKRNHEVLLRTADPAEVDGLQARFDAVLGEPFTVVESGN